MDDDAIITTAETEEVPEWEEHRGSGSQVIPPALPPSSDKEFWGDSFHAERKTEDIKRETVIPSKHGIQMVGREFICTTCPHTHSLSIDPDKYTLDHSGQIIAIDKK